MKLICIQSRVNDFTVGEIYRDKTRLKWGDCRERVVSGKFLGNWILNDGGLKVLGVDKNDPMATFKPAKSMMKMLVRAFVLVAKSRGWGDSKSGAFKSWSGTPYGNSKDWARVIAGSYDMKEVEKSMFEDDPKLKFIDQEALNLYAENEIDNW